MYRNILVPIDLAHGDLGARILGIARTLGGPEATVTALHVLEPIPTFVAAQLPKETVDIQWNDAREQLAKIAAAADPAAKVVVRQGAAATMILEEAEASKADAIVLASHRPGLRDYLLGSTAARVVRHAQCSVLVDRGA